MDAINLKSCPVCNGIAIMVEHHDKTYEVHCSSCKTPINDEFESGYSTPEEAAKAWNDFIPSKLPKDGNEMLLEFPCGLMAKGFYNGKTWQIVGLPIQIKYDPIRWMEVPE